jgi:hypothetical protein
LDQLALIGLIFLGSCVLARKPLVFYFAQRHGTDRSRCSATDKCPNMRSAPQSAKSPRQEVIPGLRLAHIGLRGHHETFKPKEANPI